jgi:hypothetical protein
MGWESVQVPRILHASWDSPVYHCRYVAVAGNSSGQATLPLHVCWRSAHEPAAGGISAVTCIYFCCV